MQDLEVSTAIEINILSKIFVIDRMWNRPDTYLKASKKAVVILPNLEPFAATDPIVVFVHDRVSHWLLKAYNHNFGCSCFLLNSDRVCKGRKISLRVENVHNTATILGDVLFGPLVLWSPPCSIRVLNRIIDVWLLNTTAV